MSFLDAYARKVLPTDGSWAVALLTITIASVSLSLPGYLQEVWPDLKVPPLLLFQWSIAATIFVLGSFVVLVLVLRHINELQSNTANAAEPVPEEIDTITRLEELREKILVVVAQNERLHDAQIAKLTGVTKQLATLHLHELRAVKFVRSKFDLDENSYQVDTWFVEQPGRKYLSNHGLL